MLDQEQIETLEARARRGEAEAFGALMRTFDQDLRRVVWSVVLSQDATDEVMQRVYAVALRSIGSVDDGSALTSWLLSISFETAMSHVRAAGETGRNAEAGASDVDGGAFARFSASAAPESDRAAIDDQLRALDPDQRGLIMLTMGMGYGFDETAAIVDMERSDVAAKAHQARVFLVEGAGPKSDLGHQLRSRVPEPADGSWEAIDAELAQIADADDARATDAGNGSTDAMKSGSRNLMAVAAVIAVIALAAMLVNTRTSATADTTVDTQPETTETVVGAGQAIAGQTPLEALRSRLEPGDSDEPIVRDDGVMFCFRGEATSVLVGADAVPGRTVASIELAGDGRLYIFAYQPGVAPAAIEATVVGEADGVIDVPFDLLMGGDGVLPIYPVTISDDSLTLSTGNTLALVSCGEVGDELDAGYSIATAPVPVDIDGPVVMVANQGPIVWRFLSGPVNFRANPGLDTEIIDQWAGTEAGILGTGRMARGDGYDWVELAATDEKSAGWVAREFIEPDPTYNGRLCYQTGETAMVLEFSTDSATFVGGLTVPAVEGVEHFGVSGRRAEGALFEVRLQDTQSALISEQQWSSSQVGMSTDLGSLDITDCSAMTDTVDAINAIVTSYPPLPA